MCLPTALALPLHSCGDFGSPRVIGSSARCYKSAVTIKSIEASFEEPECASGKTRGGGGFGPVTQVRKMLAHYRMLRFLRWGRWRSAKATIRTFWNLYVGGRNLER
jgi:hypothetical protein